MQNGPASVIIGWLLLGLTALMAVIVILALANGKPFHVIMLFPLLTLAYGSWSLWSTKHSRRDSVDSSGTFEG